MVEATTAERRYRRKLLALVSSAGFFEGDDSFVLAFVTADILRTLDVPVRHGGLGTYSRHRMTPTPHV